MVQLFGTILYYLFVLSYISFSDSYRNLDPLQQKAYLAALVGLQASFYAVIPFLHCRHHTRDTMRLLQEHQKKLLNPAVYPERIPFSQLEGSLASAAAYCETLQFFRRASFFRNCILELDDISEAIHYTDLDPSQEQ